MQVDTALNFIYIEKINKLTVFILGDTSYTTKDCRLNEVSPKTSLAQSMYNNNITNNNSSNSVISNNNQFQSIPYQETYLFLTVLD